MTKTFLHVGCGSKRKGMTTRVFAGEDWRELRFDIDESARPDIVGTMLDMSAVQDASVDAVFSSHNIEHLYAHEVPVALGEFRRVLKPDGFLVLTCPDLQSICKLVAEDKLTDVAYSSLAGPIAPIDVLYGYRPKLKAGNHYMAHKCGFTLRVLVGTLKSAEFETVTGWARGRAPHFDLWALASVRQMEQSDIEQLAKDHFPTGQDVGAGLSETSR